MLKREMGEKERRKGEKTKVKGSKKRKITIYLNLRYIGLSKHNSNGRKKFKNGHV
jgi:hypothetical protein